MVLAAIFAAHNDDGRAVWQDAPVFRFALETAHSRAPKGEKRID
jgi:hypothetical protein